MPEVTFGPFQLDLERGELRRSGAILKLQPQPARLLTYLVSRAGQLVTREEIRGQLWGAETFVDFDQSVNFSIRQIRATLHDDADKPCYVETVPRRGYRFIAPIQPTTPTLAAPNSALDPGRSRARDSSRHWLGRALLVSTTVVIVAIIGTILSRTGQRAPATEAVSLAVLPFDSLDGQEYFADGMTEELRTELARLQVQGLTVIARTSVMSYKGTTKTPSQIGRELGVGYVLQGSTRRSTNTVRITVQLVKAAENRHVWAQTYDRPLADALIVQREMARSVAEQMQLMLTPEQHRRMASTRPIDPSVHEQVLMGRFFLHRINRADTMKAIEFFEAAIARDTEYADAYAGLAVAYNTLGSVFIAGKPPANARLLAIRAATRATQLDPDLAEAHAAFGYTMLHELDWVQAERALTHAIKLNPSDGAAHNTYASYLIARGRLSEAVEEARRALALDPVSVGARHTLAWMLYFNHDYASAIRELQTTLQMNPNYTFGRWRLGQVEIVTQRFDDAVLDLEQAAKDSRRAPAVLGLLAMAYAGQGRHAAAQRLVDELRERSATETVPAGAIALAYIGAGDKSHAIASLQEVYDSHDNYAIYLSADPLLDSLRTEPSFQALRRRIDNGADGKTH